MCDDNKVNADEEVIELVIEVVTPQLLGEMGQLIAALMDDREMFTKFEVSVAVRQLGYNVRHGVLRDFYAPLLAPYMAAFGYNCEIIKVEDKHGNEYDAQLLLPDGADSALYENPFGPKEPTELTEIIVLETDDRGRYTVSKRFLDLLGAKDGDTVNVHVFNGDETIFITLPGVGPDLVLDSDIRSQYVVHKGNVTIPAVALLKGGFKEGQPVIIKSNVDDNVIVFGYVA